MRCALKLLTAISPALFALQLVCQAPFPTNRYKAGPQYWDSYGFQQLGKTTVSEAMWKANADWVAENVAKAGYDMVSTDGWVSMKSLTANGYAIKHDESWTMTWAQMYSYLQAEKDATGKAMPLKLGVYWNPLWISPTAVQNPSAYEVVGTNYTVASLADQAYDGGKGDRVGGWAYWVQAQNPGAEEYIRGYVDFFAQQGATFLRLDFVSFYSCGCSKGKQIGKSHQQYFGTVLNWIQDEASKKGIFISLVMPNLWMQDGSYKPGNPLEAYNERMYANSVRINEDSHTDTWADVSSNNQYKRYSSWSQFSNMIDGLVYWSRYSGNGGIILDADFRQLANSTNDERMAKMSYMIMSGSQIAIADYVTPGQPVPAGLTASIPYYTNTELVGSTGIRATGFVGYPLINYQNPGSATVYADPTDSTQTGKNQIWVGKVSSGSLKGNLIVAMFNRNGTLVTRNVDFVKDLGLSTGAHAVHDMWSHQDLGSMTSYSGSVNPHGVVMLRISNTVN